VPRLHMQQAPVVRAWQQGGARFPVLISGAMALPRQSRPAAASHSGCCPSPSRELGYIWARIGSWADALRTRKDVPSSTVGWQMVVWAAGPGGHESPHSLYLFFHWPTHTTGFN
jgi:hypothetical protein